VVACSAAGTVYSHDPSWIVDALSNYSTPSKLPPGIENRVMFDEDIGWALSKENTDRIVKRLSAAGFNVYIPCVWHGAGAYFNSSIAYQNPQIRKRTLFGDDPLEYLIKKAHENNIEVHPWFTVVRRDDTKYKNFYDEFSPEVAFDVHNKAFRDFIVSLMIEVVKKYNVDGLNLDYIRSMGYCTSDKCAKEYGAKTSRNLTADLILEKVPKSRIKSIEVWNEEPIEEIVQTVSEKAKTIKPNIMLSVDSVPNARHMRMQGHDSQKWLNKRWIDTIFYMEYDNEFKIEDIQLAKSRVDDPDSIVLILSLYDLENPGLEKKPGTMLQKSILASEKIWPNSGVAFYHYKQFTDEQQKVLAKTVYAQKACSTWRKCQLEGVKAVESPQPNKITH
jgi:uncharacterized lipoprotein YddW (UPF0748 family)